MNTEEIAKLQEAAEQAQQALAQAVEAQRKEAINQVKDLIKTFGIKEREVKAAFPKTSTRKPRTKKQAK
jgi:Xaa-Pro aminopeptidase